MSINYWYKKEDELLNEINNTVLPDNSLAFWFVGQGSMVIKGKKTIIYVDPFFSLYLDENGISKRNFMPPFKPDKVKQFDFALCSHNHKDHLDDETLVPMSKACPDAKFVVPAPHIDLMEKMGIEASRIIPGRAAEELKLGEASVIPIAAAHEKYQINDKGEHLFLGYIIKMNGITLYHSGDTIETQELNDTLKPMKIDIACLPINGRDLNRNNMNIIGNMNPREAGDLAENCNIDLVVPLHYDMFSHNGENPAYFADCMIKYHPTKKFHIMKLGERFIYIK